MPQNTCVFCHTPNNCYHICTYPTVMQIIVSTTDDLRPHQPPPLPLPAVSTMLVLPSPLPWLLHCRHHCRRCHRRCHCNSCRHLCCHQHRFCCHCYRFLVDCCLPLRCLCFGHHCLPLRLPLLAANAIATFVTAANRCPLLLPPQPCDVQNMTFKVIF